MNSLDYRSQAPACLREFLDYMSTIKGRSENTVFSYFSDLKLFFRFLRQKNGLDKGAVFEEIDIRLTPDEFVKNAGLYDAMEFLHFMNSERENSAKSRARRAVALRQYYKYLTDVRGWYTVSPMEKLQLPSPKKSLPKHLTLEQAGDLLDVKIDDNSFAGARDFCMLTLFLNCGMRLAELVSINVTDIRHTRDSQTDGDVDFLVVTGKGNKERVVYLNNACVSAVNAYIEKRGEFTLANPAMKKEKALFVSRKCSRISHRRVQQIIELSLKSAGLSGQGMSVHKLRHTAATLMYQNGVDVRVLKEILGHENLDTTQIYTHVADRQIEQAMKQNPLAGRGKNGG